MLDLDGDGFRWVKTSSLRDSQYSAWENNGHNGGDALSSFSYYRVGSKGLTPDNVAVSPAITLPASNEITLRWWVMIFDTTPGNYGDTYALYVYDGEEALTEENAARLLTTPLFKETVAWDGIKSEVYYERTADLSAYAGKTVRLALRHFESNDKYILTVDDLAVEAAVWEIAPQVFEVKPAEEQPDETIDVSEATEELRVR